MELSPPRGTADVFPPRSEELLTLERAAHELARVYGYRYVQTPAFEHTELFTRTSGESSDVVTKEMYTFEDKGGRSLTLRPEGTAPVMRGYLERRQDLPVPFKAYYVESFWRHGRPQAGRLREFRQLGIEIIGTEAPAADVETIVVADRFLRDRGLERTTLLVNSIGDATCRPAYRLVLVAFLHEHENGLCKDCRVRIDTNPLRAFDCKEDGCRAVMGEAPVITDHLCEACGAHFAAVQEGLETEEVSFEIDRRLVRGLDYYTRTAFEFVSAVLPAAQATVCGGGRYDGLAEELGGPPTPGIGFGLGLERVLLAVENEHLGVASDGAPACFVVGIGEEAPVFVRNLVRTLRRMGIASGSAFEDRPLKAQLKMADRAGARFAAIIGDREVQERVVTIKDLKDGSQAEVPLGEVGPWISARA